MPGPKPQPASVRDAKGNPGKRARTGAKKAKPAAPPVVTKPADLALTRRLIPALLDCPMQ